jgi:acetylornithine/succinyldiaminopimelate/putrescine aminotransferase
MGRTGKMFATQHYGVDADIVCIAKGIASGLPLGLCVARAGLMDWKKGRARIHFRRQSGLHRRGFEDESSCSNANWWQTLLKSATI